MGPLISSLVSSEMALLIHLQHSVSPALWRERYISWGEGQWAQGRKQENGNVGRWPFWCTMPLMLGMETPQEELGATQHSSSTWLRQKVKFIVVS